MQTYMMVTRLAPEAVRSPHGVEALERRVMNAVRGECPNVEWIGSYALTGPWDYLDLFRAPDQETATKVAILFRLGAHAHVELWPALPWERFKQLLDMLPEHIGELVTAR